MAKKKQDMTNNNNNGNSRRVVDDNENDDDDTVAIKLMRNDEYAKREIAILSELSLKYPHPNIVRLLQSYNNDNDDDGVVDGGSKNGGGSCCIVLSLAHGPTLNHIIHNYGALGFVIAQCISRQLISAVAFLHGHAVIHRDIQPCNIIVSGGVVHDDLWWSDELDVDGKLLRLARQCHITLIDFGFARALGRNDILDDAGLKKVMDESYETFLLTTSGSPHNSTNQKVAVKDELLGPCLIDQVLEDTLLSGLKKSRNSGGKKTSVFHDDSVSRKQIIDLSE
jgi:serine/threonine protein kinase